MKCPLCGSEITAGATYCPVCGADVEAARRRAQGTAQTQQMPRQARPAPSVPQAGQPQGRAGRRAAVPMNSSLPPQQAKNLRSFDTKSMNAAPKWPIVLIVLLALVIVVALVLIFLKPWQPASTTPATTQLATTPVASSSSDARDASSASTHATSAVAEQPSAAAPQAAPAAATDAQAYETLQGIYGSMSDLSSRISDVANEFNTYYNSSDMAQRQTSLNNALAVQSDVAAQTSALTALVLPAGSQYAATVETYKTLLNDLKMRIDVLVEGWQNSVAGKSEAEITEPVGRYNGPDGISTYKADFDATYPGAAPAAPAA